VAVAGLAAGGLVTGAADAVGVQRKVELVASVVGPRAADDSDDGFDPNRQPGGGAYGPYTCKSGFVWRDSYDGDHRCVTPAERKRVHDDNPDRQPGGGAYGP
jgi:hypothetical protein